jgi:phenylacetate-CoA ligase
MTGLARARREAYFGLHRVRGGQLGSEYRMLREQDRRGVDGREVQRAALADLFDHCRASVPYYGPLLGAREAEWRRDPEAVLRTLPLLTKDIIRARFDDLKAHDVAARGVYATTSGGSTGEPIRLLQDRRYWDRAVATQLLHGAWAGRELGELEANVWGSERDILEGGNGLMMRVANALTNKRYLNAFQMTPEQMRTFLGRLNEWKPRLTAAYASAIYELARFARNEGIAVEPQNCVVTTSGTLYDHMRETIAEVFGCPVLNRYGSREVGDIAAECRACSGLHVFPWTNYVEILDADGEAVAPGEEGEIVVTSLHNRVMPLVRYRIGDRGVLGADAGCPCGRRWQRLERVSGRTVDVFKRRDGGLVDGEYFTHLLYYRDWVQTFQVIQTDHEEIQFKVVPAGEAPAHELEEIERGARAAMGDCRVTFSFVDAIAPSASGKYRYTISEL